VERVKKGKNNSMSEEAIIRHCSPTLAGLKTGNLFTFYYPNRTAMQDAVRKWNRKLHSKGIRVIPLRYRDKKALIYLYRPSMLARDIRNQKVSSMLEECGYSLKSGENCIAHLIRRLAENEEFPHEIGLFLGYPPEDVRGFINNKACGFKCVGYWKVYGEKERAEKLFSRYKKCSEVYHNQWSKGKSIERLTVIV